jgi:hypothetical protein
MRIAISEIDEENSNLRHVLFVCSCGLTSEQLVAADTSSGGRRLAVQEGE